MCKYTGTVPFESILKNISIQSIKDNFLDFEMEKNIPRTNDGTMTSYDYTHKLTTIKLILGYIKTCNFGICYMYTCTCVFIKNTTFVTYLYSQELITTHNCYFHTNNKRTRSLYLLANFGLLASIDQKQ